MQKGFSTNTYLLGGGTLTKFKKVEFDEIKEYRNQYLDSIYESQELYIEWIVLKSDYFIIEIEEPVGYFIISPENIMVEFYLTKSSIKYCEWIFKKVMEEFKVEKIYCKSFDSLLMKCCHKRSMSYEIIGTLFRDYIDTEMDDMSEYLIRKATKDDIPCLLLQKDELYESEDELYLLVKNNNIYMYYFEGQLVGCGFIIKVLEDRNYYDIGMWVKTEYRNRGIASRIISNLKGACIKNHMIPICGCAVDNIASKKTLEKNGFHSKHDLIEYKV